MSQVAIESIITKALVAWATTKNIPVARESQPFKKPAENGTFIELNIIPSDTTIASVDGTRKRYLGEVICNVWTRDGVGTGAAKALAEEIAALFPVVPKIYLPVSVETIPSIKRPIHDPSGYIILPCSFLYRAEY